jgi:uncharacterized membrane protein (UPF0127 family)
MNPFRRIALGVRNCLSFGSSADPEIRMQVKNLTRNTVLATCLEVANTGSKRNKGLLGRERLSPGEGMWILPCAAVHTFWMHFSIDLIYLDRKNRIQKLSSGVPPWRLSACLWAHSVIELPSGTICNTQTRAEDNLDFSVVPSPVASLPESR